MEFFAATDKGMKRKDNQDYFCLPKGNEKVFVVCDGMGGHAAGDTASRTAAESVYKYITMHSTFDLTEEKARELVGGAIEYANKIVNIRSSANVKYEGMGTTADVCLIDVDTLYAAHVGDSRVYLMRDGELKQITKDHTLVQKMVDDGVLTKEQAEKHPDRHVLTRAIGSEPLIEYDFNAVKLLDNDIILMCSDGLTNMLDENSIKVGLISGNSLKETVNGLIDAANKNGGSDNITALVIRI